MGLAKVAGLLRESSITLDNGVIVARLQDHVLTTLPSGETSANWPHPEEPSYVEIAHQCGFRPDMLMAYCHEHEVLHSLLPLRFFDRPGYTVRMAAQGKKADLAGAMAEERLIYYIQRLVGDPTFPCPDTQWSLLADEVISMGIRV